MRFKVVWLEERVGFIDADDIKAAESYMRARIKLLEGKDQKAKLLEIRKFEPESLPPVASVA